MTEQLNGGANAIGLLVGRGWQYMEVGAALSAWGGDPAGSAHRATAKALLSISFADQQHQHVVTDTTWMATVDGPIVAHNVYGFEVFDARSGLDICAGGPVSPSGHECEATWATASFDGASGTWKQAEALDEYPNATVSQQIVPAIRQLQLNKAVSVTPITINNGSTPVTVYVYDMGQNAAGGVRLTVPAGCPAGRRIAVYLGEALYTANGSSPRARVAGPPSQGTRGTVDQTNLLGAKARIEFICAGSPEATWYEPTFTYFGFQFAELVGYPGVPTLDTLQQRIIHSDVESEPSDVGIPRTPNGAIDMGGSALLRSISSAVRLTLVANLYSVPTDCPQRSERWGWMADGSLSAEANYYYHAPSEMYRSWLTLMQDVQDDPNAGCKAVQGPQGDSNLGGDGKPNCSGSVGIITPGISPLSSLQSLPGEASWSIAYPLVFSLQHRYMADASLARSMFPGIRKYVGFMDWVARNSTVSGLTSFVQFGDWLSPRPSKIVDEMSSAFNHAQAIRIARDTATALGHPSAEAYSAAYSRAQLGFHAAYYKNGTYGNGEQAALVYALYLGSAPAHISAAVLEQLIHSIQADPRCRPCLATGILSTKWIMETLSLHGRTDVALSLALKTASPSWGHMVQAGATTISESWTSVDEVPGQLKTSRSHPALAGVGAWFYRWVAGVRLADNTPGLAPPGTYGRGFARTLFAPGWVTDPRVPYARANLTTAHGPLQSHWAWDSGNGSLRMDLTMPPKTSAEIRFPAVIKPQVASVVAVDEETKTRALVWYSGKYHPGAPGVTGAAVVSPGDLDGGGDGSELISVTVSDGAHSLVATCAVHLLKTTDESALRVWVQRHDPHANPHAARHFTSTPAAFGNRTRFGHQHGATVTWAEIEGVVDLGLGDVIYPQLPFIYQPNATAMVRAIRQRGWFVSNLYDYSVAYPTDCRSRYPEGNGVCQFQVTHSDMQLLAELGDHFGGFEIGEKDSAIAGGFGSLTPRGSGGESHAVRSISLAMSNARRVDEWWRSQQLFERMAADLGYSLSFLAAAYYPHYVAKSGYVK